MGKTVPRDSYHRKVQSLTILKVLCKVPVTSFIRVGSIDCNTMLRMRTWEERLCHRHDTELLH